MRGILFRGKRLDNGEWVMGDGIHFLKSVNYKGTCWIDGMREKANDWIPVDPNTVGQYTGLRDKNGTKIFEWHIVRDNNGRIGYIVFLPQDAGWAIVWKDCDSRMGHRSRDSHYHADPTLEVIGNIHDNPELVKEEPK